MKILLKMNKIVYLYFLVWIIFSQQNTQKQKSDFIIESIDCYDIKFGYADKLITNFDDALELGIVDSINSNNLKTKKYYSENAEYIFRIGGGCFTPFIDELYTKANNDTIKIYWEKKAIEPCPEVGKVGPFCGKIIINKKKYPNYKKLTFVKIYKN